MQEMQETQVLSLDREDSPGGGNGNLLQDSCLENPVDRGAMDRGVHGVAKSRAQLKGPSTAQHMQSLGEFFVSFSVH